MRVKKLIERNFHALMHKNFRYFWMGQCASLIGTWMQNIGQSWLVLSITNSPFLLGILTTVQFIPVTIFSLFAGVIVDRFPKKRLLLFTQASSMILAFILSAMVFSNTVKYEYILIVAFLLGCINCIDMPTRQAFTVEIAGKEDLMNAIALNSSIFNLARILGPSIGAVVMAYFGAAWCFFFNGVSYLAVLYGLYNIDVDGNNIKQRVKSNIISEIKDGLSYVKNDILLLETLLMVCIIGIFAFNYNVLVPSFTKLVLDGNEKTYGLLMSFLGAGSLVGALNVSIRSKRGPKMKVAFISSIVISAMLILNGLNKSLAFTSLLLIITGFFNIAFSTTSNSLLQLNSKDEYRGRVMSIYSLVFAGATPIGSLLTGWICDKIGASAGFLVSGGAVLILVIIIRIIFKTKKIDTTS
ncbi:MFS transporter [Clostridium sp. YIM B02551]|uniref:MFS transporter n=1 Tax=Clostridium sp. YIM B02551 TaxID=2910679 RepID=UPI001EEBC4B5|nr:MFS transporter [Clostridium sp. YIM B02551]